jgi:hypothetical protein
MIAARSWSMTAGTTGAPGASGPGEATQRAGQGASPAEPATRQACTLGLAASAPSQVPRSAACVTNAVARMSFSR